uniref:Immunoglobulin V-set domain-containing protein n=1 Tax=Anas platyrhynchos TaxID=8839 RepID=A0A8B9SYC8_ANAPL
KVRLTAALLGSGSSARSLRLLQRGRASTSSLCSSNRANWYREKPDGSLEWIYWSAAASKPKGKYSGTVNELGFFSLNISNVQREDSGYYYSAVKQGKRKVPLHLEP